MNTRTVFISIIILIVLAIAGIVVYSLVFKGSAAPAPTYDTGSTGTLPDVGQNLPASQALASVPTSTLLSIGTSKGVVQVENFYASDPQVIDDGQTVIIASTTNYFITYNIYDGSFWIAIAGTPFATIRPTAEQDLVTRLGVNSADACKLNVSVGVPYNPANTKTTWQSLPLSFCTSTGAFQSK